MSKYTTETDRKHAAQVLAEFDDLLKTMTEEDPRRPDAQNIRDQTAKRLAKIEADLQKQSEDA